MLMKQSGITSPIIGPRTMAQFEDNLGAVNVQINEEDEQRLDEVAPREEATASYVNGLDYDYTPSRYN